MSGNKRRVKILILTPWYPSPAHPYTATFVKDQVEILNHYFNRKEDKGSFKFAVLHIKYPTDIINALRKKNTLERKIRCEENSKIPVIHEQAFFLSHRINLGKNKNSKKAILRAWEKAMHILDGRPDVIIAVTLSGLIMSNEINGALGLNIPLLFHEHSVPIDMHLKSEGSKAKAEEALKKSKAIVIVAERQRKEIEKLINGKTIHKIWNPAHQDFFDTEIQENKTHNPIHLVTVGHLNYQKAQDRIIKAIAKIKNTHSNVHLSIAGGGDCENQLKELTEKLGVTDKVTFLGAIGRTDIVNLLKTADIFVLSSRYENCPVALIEAQAMGVPCVCTINNGSEDILLPGCGEAVIQDEEGEFLSRAISDTINKLNQYKRQEIRNEAYRNFSPEKFAEKFYTIFESAIFQNKS